MNAAIHVGFVKQFIMVIEINVNKLKFLEFQVREVS